jgi:hypothetical protein
MFSTSASEAASPIINRTGSPVSCNRKKTAVTTPKTTSTACAKRWAMYCPISFELAVYSFQAISCAQIISSLRGSQTTQLSTP